MTQFGEIAITIVPSPLPFASLTLLLIAVIARNNNKKKKNQ